LGVIKHSVKNPSGIGTIIHMIINLIFIIFQLRLLNGKESVTLTILLCVMAACFLWCLGILLVALSRTFKKPTELYLYNEKILLDGCTIQAKEIEVILKNGYFRPIIGIKPYGKKIVPINMSFRFSEDEDRGIADLRNWAEKNNVRMVNKSFLYGI
jgi:hypothetical protein